MHIQVGLLCLLNELTFLSLLNVPVYFLVILFDLNLL